MKTLLIESANRWGGGEWRRITTRRIIPMTSPFQQNENWIQPWWFHSISLPVAAIVTSNVERPRFLARHPNRPWPTVSIHTTLLSLSLSLSTFKLLSRSLTLRNNAAHLNMFCGTSADKKNTEKISSDREKVPWNHSKPQWRTASTCYAPPTAHADQLASFRWQQQQQQQQRKRESEYSRSIRSGSLGTAAAL